MSNNDVPACEVFTEPMDGVQQSLVVRNKDLDVIAKLGQLSGRDRIAVQEPLVELAQLGFVRIGHAGTQPGRFAVAKPRSWAAVRRWRSAVTMTVRSSAIAAAKARWTASLPLSA